MLIFAPPRMTADAGRFKKHKCRTSFFGAGETLAPFHFKIN